VCLDTPRTSRKANQSLVRIRAGFDLLIVILRAVAVQVDVHVKGNLRCRGAGVGGEKGVKVGEEGPDGRVRLRSQGECRVEVERLWCRLVRVDVLRFSVARYLVDT
jgi:hypothetical protein